MRFSFASTALLAVGTTNSLVDAAVVPKGLAPALPLSEFPGNPFVKPLSIEEAKTIQGNKTEADPEEEIQASVLAAAATCTNPKIRKEWDNTSTAERNAFINALTCLMNKPASGKFSGAKNRYEDVVRVHQWLTPIVHGNAKFLFWHRYYLWAFEDILTQECGFSGTIPWFNEARYPGRFSQSSIFSKDWFGAIGLGGGCVPDGKFTGRTLNIGPQDRFEPHCLARAGDSASTAHCTQELVDTCNARTDFADMAACSEGGVHAWGHIGIGAVMNDVYASPEDPVFWLHHGFVDRNLRLWQKADANRYTAAGVTGTDSSGNRLTINTALGSGQLRPDKKISDIINTMDGLLCYRYDY